MFVATAKLKSISPYSQSKHIREPRKPKETAEDHEKRCWRERMHVDKEGMVYIPPMAFKNCLSECAKYISLQIPGKSRTTYTKHFEAGVLVTDFVELGIKETDVEGEWLFLNSNGTRGSGKRVDRCYPVIPNWQGTVVFYVLDETITQEVFAKHLTEAGRFIGIGRFRPRNNGFYGRFEVEELDWREEI